MLKVKKVSIVSLIALMCLLIAPFHVYADTTYPFSIDNIVGVNVYVTQSKYYDNNLSNTYTVYNNTIEIVLDNDYYGSADFKIQYTASNNGVNTFTKNVSFYGHIVKIDVPLGNNLYIKRDGSCSVLSVSNAQVYALNDLDFPFESYVPVTYAMANLEYTTMVGLYEWTYPTFLVPADNSNGSVVFSFYMNPNTTNVFIFGSSKPINITGTNQNIYFYKTVSDGRLLYEIDSREYVTSATYIDSNTRFYWYKITYHSLSQEGRAYISIKSSAEFYYVPIYHANVNLDNISTDFALRFGLSNRLLDALENIAPTDSSDTSAENLQDDSAEMQTQMNEMFGYEDDFNNDMNNALQNIDTNFDVGNTFGSKFLASASWVRTQFNTLTNSTPFGTVLSFSLLLGLALLIIGKAIK